MIKIKPHHFLDIIKLYGKGIDKFVPDEIYKHSFYSVANEIIKNHQAIVQITVNEDDICRTCKCINEKGLCTDKINHIEVINSKDEWNKILDKRIIEYAGLQEESEYLAHDFCTILYLIRENIKDIWREETEDLRNQRYENFCIGAKKYLEIL
ncbi:hypothetical protein [Clostridium paridis]|uniref:DUF1284 domain-containing protein n=1 Tax=Clostridium paridis TaxID=2803863 RepID=A0A937FHC1_9CLOT|nr:hypothetical protein [Clostridium paridis]MBL4932028.1 hypothetical protein [Clostridium paridis]